ncbi:hypothetical protein [Dubosiella newyorkensis]|jgi:hypothetical protein|uniref:hypothetical protein n=3 Tax=Dubosiella newyorkensis TaxID=1862672 RepID=UPI0025A5D188|nr:hypothetical protein [Dubosiella newyorkensis]MCI9041526.1 hypothetical protein [Dubosiella newyorkensis]
MNQSWFHLLMISKEPQKNYERTIKSIVPYILICLLLFVFVGYQKNWNTAFLVLLILGLIGAFELVCAKTMLNVTNQNTIQKAYFSGILVSWIVIGAISLYWIYLFGFLKALPLILIVGIGKMISLKSEFLCLVIFDATSRSMR